MPVSFAAVRVSGYRLGCRKSGVMNGTKCRGLVPDQRRGARSAGLSEAGSSRHVDVCVLVLAQDQHVPIAAVVDRQPVNNRSDAAGHPAPGHNPGPCGTLDPVKGLR